MSGSEYYDHTSYPATGAQGSSAALRAELDAVEAGFGKLPDLAGNGGKVVRINSGATAQEAVTQAVVVAEATNGAASKATPVDADEIPLVDSAASNVLKKLTWANLKATLSSTFGTGVWAWLLDPTSAKLKAAVTDETGSGGALVFADSPAFTGTVTAAGLTVSGATTLSGTIAPGVVIEGSSASTALRITQTGAGNALVVEDETNPDSSPLIVDASGRILKGHTTSINNAFSTVSGIQFHNTIVGDGASWSRWTADANGMFHVMQKSRSGTVGTRGIVSSGDQLGNIYWAGDDGASFVPAARIFAEVDGTPGANDMPGRLVFSTTADGASAPTERMRIDSKGSVGIGGIPAAGDVLRLTGTMRASGGTSFGARNLNTIDPATTTAAAYLFYTLPSVSAGTLPVLAHHYAGLNSLSGSITSQYGFLAESTLVGATNNYGFYSNIASGTGRWNFYANGTADNYFAGKVGIGAAPSSAESVLRLNTSHTGTTTLAGCSLAGQVQADVTANWYAYRNFFAQTGTLSNAKHFSAAQGTIATVTQQFGFSAESSLVGATSNYGFHSDIPSGTGRWNFYAAGTAANYFAGDLTVYGATAIPAGGTAGTGYKFSSTSNFGVFFGSGAPTLSAAKGSLYLRSDGTTTNNRAYINTDGGTTWTALTTVA